VGEGEKRVVRQGNPTRLPQQTAAPNAYTTRACPFPARTRCRDDDGGDGVAEKRWGGVQPQASGAERLKFALLANIAWRDSSRLTTTPGQALRMPS
jgi:hypothetical protein